MVFLPEEIHYLWISGKLEGALTAQYREISEVKGQEFTDSKNNEIINLAIPWADQMNLSLFNTYMELKRKHIFVVRSITRFNRPNYAIFNIYTDKINFKNK